MQGLVVHHVQDLGRLDLHGQPALDPRQGHGLQGPHRVVAQSQVGPHGEPGLFVYHGRDRDRRAAHVDAEDVDAVQLGQVLDAVRQGPGRGQHPDRAPRRQGAKARQALHLAHPVQLFQLGLQRRRVLHFDAGPDVVDGPQLGARAHQGGHLGPQLGVAGIDDGRAIAGRQGGAGQGDGLGRLEHGPCGPAVDTAHDDHRVGGEAPDELNLRLQVIVQRVDAVATPIERHHAVDEAVARLDRPARALQADVADHAGEQNAKRLAGAGNGRWRW